jgi:hypothetical protein
MNRSSGGQMPNGTIIGLALSHGQETRREDLEETSSQSG